MSPHFKRVGLIGKASGERVATTLQTLSGYLDGLGVEIRYWSAPHWHSSVTLLSSSVVTAPC